MYLIEFDEVSITISQSVQSEVQIIIFVLGLGSHHGRDALHKLIIHRVYQPGEVGWISLVLNKIYVLRVGLCWAGPFDFLLSSDVRGEALVVWRLERSPGLTCGMGVFL